MDDRESNLDGTPAAPLPMRLLRRLGLFQKIFTPCENSSCKQLRPFASLFLRGSEGIRLQGRWYCGPDCFEHAAQKEFRRLCAAPEPGLKKAHRMPIGLLMLSRGMISDAQLKQALALQREQGIGKIGRLLQDIGAATENDVAAGLAAQWGCSVYPLEGAAEFLQCASLLPLSLLEAGRMLPVHHVQAQQTLYLAFVEGIDRNALYAVDQMLNLKTIPCIVSESAYLDAIGELSRAEDLRTTVFESRFDSREMASTTRSYAWRVGSDDVSIVRSGRFIWVRLQSLQGPKDILFRLFADVQ
jgi:hypothetical protein